MTPKEKAIELYEKYAIWSWNEVVCDYEIAKQCALIAVDETFNYLTSVGITGTIRSYWQEVKQEIELL